MIRCSHHVTQHRIMTYTGITSLECHHLLHHCLLWRHDLSYQFPSSSRKLPARWVWHGLSLTRHREPVGCAAAPPSPPLLRPHARCSHAASSSSADAAPAGSGDTCPSHPHPAGAHPQAGRNPSARHWHPSSPGLSLYLPFLSYVCRVCLPLIRAPHSRAQRMPCVQTAHAGLATKRQAVRQVPANNTHGVSGHCSDYIPGNVTVNRYTLLNASSDHGHVSFQNAAQSTRSPP